MARRSIRNAVPFLVVGALLIAAVTLVAMSRFRRGSTVLAAALLLTAGMRLLLPAERLGPLAVRSRGFDVAFCTALGGAVMWLVLLE
ncbi:DUF3017 domain-containing protein [Nakamurella deserti]|uniref:DUF3017 domain-containing protein n=1 Tax=Nakamurella deserti TaxID=2164074 RepID=UPI000DBE596F|nr:DUF3017 domain-containing protein [Nakamurella deserti]